MSAARLFRTHGGPIAARMNIRFPCFLVIGLLPALPAAAETNKPAPGKLATADSPKSIGKFDDWTAATHKESGQTVCYAFTRAQSSAPALPARGAVVLMVAERPSGRDAVVIEAGVSYAPSATLTVQVDLTGLEFYTDPSSPRNAFAKNAKAAIAAFGKGTRAIARSPTPNGTVTDAFSLRGFGEAYKAIVKACPGK